MRIPRSSLLPLSVALGASAIAGCSGSSGHATRAPRRATTTTVGAQAPLTTPAIPWSRLRNPILASRDHGVKDAALVPSRGMWFALFSYVDARGVWRIGIAHSTDLHSWSAPVEMPHDPTISGEASPDVVRAPDGRFVVTYQSSLHDRDGAAAKLWYRTTTDFVHFSAPRRLLQPVHSSRSDRLIDAALAWTPAGLLLGYKVGAVQQAFEIARSTTGSLDGPWQLVGRPDIRVYGDTIENYQFTAIDGHWKLLATSNVLDRPFLFDLAGNPADPKGWLHWSAGRRLQVPKESWNTGTGLTGSGYEHANSAYLVDQRLRDGHFYLLYEDAPEMSSFGGQGHGRLAIARSTDLVHWSVPPG